MKRALDARAGRERGGGATATRLDAGGEVRRDPPEGLDAVVVGEHAPAHELVVLGPSLRVGLAVLDGLHHLVLLHLLVVAIVLRSRADVRERERERERRAGASFCDF